MSKVKKPVDVTPTRRNNDKVGQCAPNGASGKAKKPARRTRRIPAKTSKKQEVKAPTVAYRVRELDPLAMCGRRTTVQQLYRVDEVVDGAPHAHLVFFDRHGWYCEHGPDCPAVVHARKFEERGHAHR